MSDSFETSPGDQRLSVRITSSIVGSTVRVSKLDHEDNAQPQFLVGARLAREDGPTADEALTAVPHPL
ncbi:hypothetical protein OH720_20760 [Pseudomonas sp. WJP1]|uniref:hypothetical protein n=1 Tax=Pseudomonas sp. WJP1 TaxID=2986947 RepID=UPI00234982CE|nr:hypothetical protein [Pseudomonas sp. WJP1]WCM49421.1 hypothetical protein OH720_20760 [Pseudomonas sp. WJP1]